MPAERLLTINETAKLWGCSARTVRRKIQSGELEAIRLTARAARIRESVVVRYIDRLASQALPSGDFLGSNNDPSE